MNSNLEDLLAYMLFCCLVYPKEISYDGFFFGGGYVLFQGATIRRDEHTGAVIVARIMRGGAADRSGKFLKKGGFKIAFINCFKIPRIMRTHMHYIHIPRTVTSN